MDETLKVCIDRVLPRELMRFQRTMRDPTSRACNLTDSPIGKTWMNSSTLPIRFMDGALGGLPPSHATRDEPRGA